MVDLTKFKRKDVSSIKAPEKGHGNRSWIRPAILLSLIFLLALIAVSAGFQDALAANPPIVNGQFYGDDDYMTYWPFGYSVNGSVLYAFYDPPTLYVALVVDREINDTVCANPAAPGSTEYAQDAGFPSHRSCAQLTDLEYASFNLRCPAAPNEWSWQQGFAGEDPNNAGFWISGTNVGGGLGTPPPGYVAGSSFAWNINNYKAWLTPYPGPGGPPWDLYDTAGSGSIVAAWHSPVDSADREHVVGLDGYPANNPENTIPIVYSPFYQWEWPMVYEWSADLTDCGPNPVFLTAGELHHSPSKFPLSIYIELFEPFFDLGDLPDSYSTLMASGGPSHEFVLTNNVFLGPTRDNDADGQPELDATGDDLNDGIDDEDGVTLSGQHWANGVTVDIDISLQGLAPTADVAMWLDWDVSGTFECSEFYSFLDLPVGATNTVQVTIPGAGSYNVGDPVHMRVRAFDDETNAPGGTLECTDFGGAVENGEVEDYVWQFGPTAITLRDVSADPSTGLSPLVWLGLLLLMVVTAIGVARRRRQEAA